MSFIIDFFSSIIGTIQAIISLLISTIVSMLKILTMIPTYIDIVLNMAAFLPPWLYAYAGLIIVIMVIWGIRRAV